MIGLVQRVRQASVTVDGAVVGAIGPGLLLLVCAEPADTEIQAARLVDKLLKLRIFSDAPGKMNRSLVDVAGGLLVVSQFTLAADVRGGNRPSFSGAAGPEQGRALYEAVLRLARDRHPDVQAGVFGADMQVALVNDGPVTIPLHIAGHNHGPEGPLQIQQAPRNRLRRAAGAAPPGGAPQALRGGGINRRTGRRP